eukprot:scaffold60155_cov18-Phaeocystis_antarctica.AAC.1
MAGSRKLSSALWAFAPATLLEGEVQGLSLSPPLHRHRSPLTAHRSPLTFHPHPDPNPNPTPNPDPNQ